MLYTDFLPVRMMWAWRCRSRNLAYCCFSADISRARRSLSAV